MSAWWRPLPLLEHCVVVHRVGLDVHRHQLGDVLAQLRTMAVVVGLELHHHVVHPWPHCSLQVVTNQSLMCFSFHVSLARPGLILRSTRRRCSVNRRRSSAGRASTMVL